METENNLKLNDYVTAAAQWNVGTGLGSGLA